VVVEKISQETLEDPAVAVVLLMEKDLGVEMLVQEIHQVYHHHKVRVVVQEEVRKILHTVAVAAVVPLKQVKVEKISVQMTQEMVALVQQIQLQEVQ
jgi:hypothetical protein